MEELGHKFWPWYKTIIPTTVAIKMVMAMMPQEQRRIRRLN